MAKHPYRLLITALLLGWAFDFLFWQSSIGFNFAIFIAICLLSGYILLQTNNLKPSFKSFLLILPIISFAVIAFSRQEPLTLFLAYTLTVFAMGIFTVTYEGGRWMQYSLLDLFYKFAKLIGSVVTGGLAYFLLVRKEQAEQEKTKSKFPIWPVLRGIGMALPVVICFGSLLTSADLVFRQMVFDLFDLFSLGKIAENITRLINILLWAYMLAGALIHAATQSKDEKLISEDKPAIKPFGSSLKSVRHDTL